MEAIDSLQPPTRDFSKPLLMPICDVVRSLSLGQVSACGKLEAGALQSGSKVHAASKLSVWVVDLCFADDKWSCEFLLLLHPKSSKVGPIREVTSSYNSSRHLFFSIINTSDFMKQFSNF